MIRCPFCHFDNEDGALFCEQCKSDLTGVPSNAPAVPVAEAMPMEAAPAGPGVFAEMVAEAMPAAQPIESAPVAEAVSEPSFPAVTGPYNPADAVPALAEIMPAEPEPISVPQASPAPAEPAPAPAASVLEGSPSLLPPSAQPRLLVLRGQKRNVEYPIYEGPNFIGRADEKPVDIDLDDQEPPDRVWTSRQHACISFEAGLLSIEDLNSANGTYVNRTRVYPGPRRPLAVNDIIQIGTVQLKVLV
jgi:hypothetical protein